MARPPGTIAPALFLILLVWQPALSFSAAQDTSAEAGFFESRIRPLLVDHCYACHSAQAEQVKGELLLDSKEGVVRGGKDGPVIVAGEPGKSRLIQAVRWTDKDLRMPPKRRLSERQIADLVEWIKIGAPDPRINVPKPARGPISVAAARAMWAFSAPRDHPLPAVKQPGWCKSPIDHFILARLEQNGLSPAKPADKRTLIRRAYFDLIGLPPTPEEVDAFVADDAHVAFARIVDRLLASPRYGERWARHWLDVVRYTDSFDSRGLGGEGDVTFAWRYRDWVIKALNEDMPYEQFVMNQIAGDLLPASQPGEFNKDGLVATCMYVLGNWPNGDADREKMMTDIVDDQIDVTGRAFLGVTLACARCHDHKFDPITQKDYYGLAGIFFSSHFLPSPGSKTSGSALLRMPMASAADVERRKQYDQKLATLQKRIEQFTDEQYTRLARSLLPRVGDYLTAAWELGQQGADKPAAMIRQFAAQRSLDEYVLRRWVDYLDNTLHARPAHKRLTRPIHNAAGIAGVDGWQGADGRPDPVVLANNTDHPVSFSTLTLPAKSLAVHPGPTTGVAIGWTSPISGSVQLRGRVIDADPNCGDGIEWRIERGRAGSLETLAVGAFPNGGRQDFEQADAAGRLASIDLKPGDVLQLTVFPKGDYTCDTTIVQLTIAQREGERRIWDIGRDLVPDVLAGEKGNPHADSLGHPGVWEFFETGEESAAADAAPGSAMAAWLGRRATFKNSDELRRASQSVADALLAMDHLLERRKKSGKDASTLTSADSKLYGDWTDPRGPFWGAARKDASHLPSEAKGALAGMSGELAELQKGAPPQIELANAMAEGGIPQSEYEGTHDSFVLIRGRYDRKGERVPRALPRLLAGDHQTPIGQGSGRLQLARWIASPDNPMTAKVMVNRIWQHHFSEGIVRTPNNYGKLGVPPTHPDLLDYLALRFIDSSWSIKAIHRMIMLSSAYQQSSTPDEQTLAADPDNQLFGRMNRQRLEAEPLRDALLAVSGGLDESMGGPAFRDLTTPRRTIYLMTIRSDRSNYRMLFDAADPTAIVDQRIDSTVAPQALFLMNNPFVLDRARALARRALERQPEADRARIDWIYKLLYSRPATQKEVEIGLSAVRPSQPGSSITIEAAWEQYCQVLLCANEFVYID